MQQIGIEAAKIILSFAAGCVTLWLLNRKKLIEYTDLKRKRRLTGAKDTERTAALKEHAKTLIELKREGLGPEHLYELLDYAKRGKLPTGRPASPVTRSIEEIEKAIDESYDWVVWDRHQQEKMRMQIAGEKVAKAPDKWEEAEEEAARIEKKYGRKNLGWSSAGISAIEGKLAALLWVTGEPWDFVSDWETGSDFYTADPREFALTIQRSVIEHLQNEPVDREPLDAKRSLLEGLAFGIMVDLDQHTVGWDRIRDVEDLHEVYAMYAWRGGKSIGEFSKESEPGTDQK